MRLDDSSTTVESSIEKEGNEVEKIEDSISVSENTETKTPYNNEPKDGKNSEKKCKLEPKYKYFTMMRCHSLSCGATNVFLTYFQ